jgi:hypothetical protein
MEVDVLTFDLDLQLCHDSIMRHQNVLCEIQET